jgi:histone H3/H4
MALVWRNCSSCKKEIPVNSKYFECSVSTCNGKRTGLVFCSVPCFEWHLPGARHKDAAAIESKAPPTPHQADGPKRRIIASKPPQVSKASSPAAGQSSRTSGNQHEVLVVASKLKKYVQDSAGMNTSQAVMSVLSEKLRRLCDEAAENARQDGRKTLMDRDFK